MKITNEIVELGPDYTSSPLTIGDRWLTWPEEGTPPTVPSTLQIYQTTEAPNRMTNIVKTPSMNGKPISRLIQLLANNMKKQNLF